jgi:hypothetical protein
VTCTNAAQLTAIRDGDWKLAPQEPPHGQNIMGTQYFA